MNGRLALQAALLFVLFGSALTASAASGAPTTTSVTCKPGEISQNAESTCTTVVTGASPTGTVRWTQTSNNGAVVHFAYPLSGQSCQLAGGTCYVKVIGEAPGLVKIQALYQGDGANQGSQGSANLVINSTIAPTNSTGGATTFATTVAQTSSTSSGGVPPVYPALIAVIAFVAVVLYFVRFRKK